MSRGSATKEPRPNTVGFARQARSRRQLEHTTLPFSAYLDPPQLSTFRRIRRTFLFPVISRRRRFKRLLYDTLVGFRRRPLMQRWSRYWRRR
ncbi:hypothetical protein SLA2020_426380 [Shorea laevis]